MATHRISIDIEEDDHKYLRMCCLKLGITMKEFVISCTLDRVDACEDKWMLERWEKDGTRKEIEEERKNPNRTVYQMEMNDGEAKFIPVKFSSLERVANGL